MFLDGKTQHYQDNQFLPISGKDSVHPSQKPRKLPYGTNKLILNIIWRGRRSRKANIILKENKVGGQLILPTLRLTIKLLAKEQINRATEQNREPKTDPQKFTHLIFDKRIKVIKWRRLFNKWRLNKKIARGYMVNLCISILLWS